MGGDTSFTTVTYQNVVDVLVKELPEIADPFRAHQHDYDGQVLPHLLFADVLAHLIRAQLDEAEKHTPYELPRSAQVVMDLFERMMFESPDADVGDVNVQSFLTTPTLERHPRLWAILGPTLRRRWEEYVRDFGYGRTSTS